MGELLLLLFVETLSEEELAARKVKWIAPQPRFQTGYLAKYAKLATGADTGAVLRWE